MSLLDNGTVTASVYVEAEMTDEYSNKVMVPGGSPVSVVGRLQPSTADEQADLGQVASTLYRFISRTFPAGPWGRVVVDGKSWDIHGTPKHHTGSSLTDHYTTMLKAR